MSTQNTAGDPASEGAGGVAFENLPDRPTIRKAVAASAMGNATDEVKAQAGDVTIANSEDGVAHAIDRFILGRMM